VSNDPHRGPGFRITQCWMFAAVDQDDEEGLVGETYPDSRLGLVFMPFVATDEARRDQLRERALRIARRHGQTIRVIRFGIREVLEVIEP
jgi:hypothetical protein